MKNDPTSLCVLRLSAIGDVTNCLATIKALKDALPETEISWVIGKTEATLIGHTPGIEFITFDKSKGFAGLLALRRTLQGKHFDALLMMHASMRANLASLCIRAQRRIGFDKARARDFQWLFSSEQIKPMARPHVIEGFAQFGAHLTGRSLEPTWGIDVADASVRALDDIVPEINEYAVISPCSSERARNFRNWPSERFATIADYIAERYNLKTILSGGNSMREVEAGADICARARHAPLNLIGKTTLPQLYALLARARFLISPDSGPMHMAVSADTPAIGLFATSNPARTGPARNRQFIVNCYPQALQQYSQKTLDTARWGERVRHPEAMLLIDIEQVQRQIDQVFSTKDD